MDKQLMREYVSTIEVRIDEMLKKWKQKSRIENGDVVQIEWQFEQNHIRLDIFWYDDDEHIGLSCMSPRISWKYDWKTLNPETITKVMDRIGNFAQIIMRPLSP